MSIYIVRTRKSAATSTVFRKEVIAMMTTVYGAYPISAVTDPPHIENVVATVPYRKWEKQRDRDREKEKDKKRKNEPKDQTGEHDERSIGQIGCFFEAKA